MQGLPEESILDLRSTTDKQPSQQSDNVVQVLQMAYRS